MTPAQNLVFGKIASKSPSHHVLNLVGSHSSSRPLRIKITLAQNVPFAESLPRHQASTEFFAFLHLGIADDPTATAKRLENVLPFLHDRSHLPGIRRNGMIPPRHILIQGEVFLNHARAESNGREWDRRAQGMIAEPHLAIEGSP